MANATWPTTHQIDGYMIAADPQFIPPVHPGRMLERMLMHQRNIDFETVARKSSISVDELKAFASGTRQMTREIKIGLRKVFGEAASTLYRMQLTYDYYQAHGRRPPQRLLG